MTNARKFWFGEDFRDPRPPAAEEPARPDPAAQEEALRQAFESGVAAGRRQAASEDEARLADAVARLDATLPDLFGRLDLAVSAAETDALAYFDALARKLAGSALATYPLAAVADAALATFRHLRGVPHLAARVSAPQVEEVDLLLRRLAREGGFEGRIIVIGDDELMPGDVRLDWAEGGVTRHRQDFERAIDTALAAAASTSEPRAGTEQDGMA